MISHIWFAIVFQQKSSLARPISSSSSPSSLLRLKMQQNTATVLLSSVPLIATTDEALKLPIIQVYVGDEMKGELFCGQDVTSSMMKFSFLINRVFQSLDSIDNDSTTTVSSSSSSSSISTITQSDTNPNPPINVYSDSQLNKILPFTYIFETPSQPQNEVSPVPSSDVNIILINRLGCKQCSAAEPIYSSIINQYLSDIRFRFYQVDVDNVPEYMTQLRTRLSGTRRTFPESCSDCKNTGFEVCSECKGVGSVARGTLAVYCPVCTGYKKVRCRVCGGKCLQCG